jgi:hypothetical protein
MSAYDAPAPTAPGYDAPAPTAPGYDAPTYHPPTPQHAAPVQSRRRIALIASAIAGVLVIVAAAAAWVLIPTSADRMLAQSTQALAVAVTDLADAQTTADIREVGATAAKPAAEAERFLAGAAAGEAPAELVAVSSALTAVASLENVSGEAPQAWDSAQPALRAIAPLGLPGLEQATVTAAADNAGTVISDSAATYQAWVAENAAAVAARDAAIAEATSYQQQMQAQVDQYIELRNDLSDYMEIVDSQGSTMEEAYAQFAEAAQGRREVRDAMLALDPPASVADEHAQVIAVISDGIDAIESAQRGLDSAECYWGYCYVEDEPAYQNFRVESKRITDSLDAALADWTTAAEAAVSDAKAMPLPPKPEV